MKMYEDISDMKEYYLQILVDFYWKEDDKEKVKFDDFEYLIHEYTLENLSLEEFNLLFDIVLKINKLYDIPEFKK